MPARNLSAYELSVSLAGAPEETKNALANIAKSMKTPGALLRASEYDILEALRLIDALIVVGRARDNEVQKFRLALKEIADPSRRWQIEEARSYAKAIID